MQQPTIYLDYNATSPLLPQVAEVLAQCTKEYYANPASQHEPGRRARRAVEDARERIAELLGAHAGMSADSLIFTSGATEANNLAVRGLAGKTPGRVILSAIEHPSVTGCGERLARDGFDVRYIPVDSSGVVCTDALADLLSPETRLVSVMLGNHETGVIQPVTRITEICSRAGVPVHTDATQVAGKLPIDFRRLGVAALSFSAHKLGGPRGIGGLLLRHDIRIEPLLYGGFQQAGLRPGSEPVATPVALSAAMEFWEEQRETLTSQIADLRDRFERKLAAGWPNIVVHASNIQRLPQTTNISFPGFDRQALVMALDLAGVACSTGSACASGSSEPSPVLIAMGCDEALTNSALRFSLGALTTGAEVDEAAGRILQILNDLQARSQRRKSTRTAPL